MVITFSIFLIWLCEFIAEVVLCCAPVYWFLKPFRYLMGACAIMDLVKLGIHQDYALYASIWGFWRIVEICWLAWIACDFVTLLNPLYKDTASVRIPYAFVLSAAIYAGPPDTIDKFYAFQTVGLLVSALVFCIGCLISIAQRFEELAVTVGLLCCTQICAGEICRQMGYHPKIAQILWCAGLVLIAHAIIKYQPPDFPFPPPRPARASMIAAMTPAPNDAQPGI